MHRILGTAVGKTVKQITRLRGGSGQALPGLVVERLFPSYLARMLAQIPEGVVVVTGTNGKTTTTKMVVEMLQASGKRVLTNPTGSNLTRGIIAGMSDQATISGKLPFDVAVFELDEAFARRFVKQVKPRWVLALNVTRDQLDRFGEVDTAAAMIAETMQAATEGIVTNANDPRLLPLAQSIAADTSRKLEYFGVADRLRPFFPSENELVSVEEQKPKAAAAAVVPAVELVDFKSQHVTYIINGQRYGIDLQLSGQHNFQNAAAALALVRAVAPAVPVPELVRSVTAVTPAFGRGEIFRLQNGSALQMVLVKNPAGFRQALASYLPSGSDVMIAINDNHADGRDMSWLWDVDFSSLQGQKIYATTGKRASDMALRLQYDDIAVPKIEPNLQASLKGFCALPGDKLLLTTYTAMLSFYDRLTREAGKKL